MVILVIVISGYLLMAISNFSIDGYKWLFYWWLLVIILLMTIGAYSINGY
jgi:hypothetical protein